jgi:hypothetical protein
MTREEARNVLKVLASFQGVMEYLEQHSVSVQDACNMAIQALSQEPMREFTEEEAKAYSKALDKMYKPTGFNVFNEPCDECKYKTFTELYFHTDPEMVEQEPCEDVVSRQAVIDMIEGFIADATSHGISPRLDTYYVMNGIKALPPVTQKSKTGHCKECKYFEYDSVAKVDGIPLIVAHEICNKWGNGCKTSEDGYCYLYEPQEGSDKE